MKMAIRNIASGAILILLAVGYAWQITLLPSRDVMPNTPGPEFFPWVIFTFISILSIALLTQGIIALRKNNAKSDDYNTVSQWHKPLIMIVIFAAYLFALSEFGYIIPSVIFFASLMWLYGCRASRFIALFSLLIPTAFFVVFSYGLRVLLPHNSWGF